MRQILLVTAGIALAITVIAGGFAFTQAENERTNLSADLQYRTRTLADSLESSIEPSFFAGDSATVQKIVDRVVDKEHIVALWVFDSAGALASFAGGGSDISGSALATTAMDSDSPSGRFAQSGGQSVYVFVQPMHQGTRVVGALMVVQSASYIDETVAKIWRDNLLRLLLQLFIIALAIFVLVRWVFFRSLSRLVRSMRMARRGGVETEPGEEQGFLQPLTQEISKMTTSLREARSAASEEARMRLEKLDTPWTAERLKEFIKAYVKDRPIFVVSNREPYVSFRDKKKKIAWQVPAGGMVTALEPIMEACGGMWIAHGSGNADKETADAEGKLQVPPDEPRYTLKRVWLTPKEVKGYYDGFTNEALWPLAHMAHVRPMFREEDWKEYKKVNGLFAKTVLNEIKGVENPIILVQDYHLALLPKMLKTARPDAEVSLFWHIPWPSAAQFSICPWRKEILEGMIGADLVGFHTQQYCNNFIDTVATEVETRIDFEQFSVTRANHTAFIKPFPISIAVPTKTGGEGAPDRSILAKLGVETEFVGLGVERLDYTKGILERFKGVEFFLTQHPEYKGRFTFLQIASPSRESVPKYQEYAEEVTAEAERINDLLGTREWKPIVLVRRHFSHEELHPLYELANVCLVTSVHDGMNLVAKEYVAAKEDENGALILSQFTGAARDLRSALIVNPYSAENMADALYRALTMSPAEQHRRMKAMRESVQNYNVYRWSAEIIKALSSLE